MKNIGPKFKVKSFTDSSGVLAAILLDRNSGDSAIPCNRKSRNIKE
jgi:hypothetical protein